MKKETIRYVLKQCQESIEHHEGMIELEKIKILALNKEIKEFKNK